MNNKVESFGISDIGLVRSNNEDAWSCVPALNFFVLADGLGGHNAGEIASKEAVQILCEHMSHIAETPAQKKCAIVPNASLCKKSNRTYQYMDL